VFPGQSTGTRCPGRAKLLMGNLYRPRQKMCFYTFAFADVSYNMCTTLRRFIHGRLFFFFAVAPASPHFFVSKMMTSTQGLRKDKAKNAEPDPSASDHDPETIRFEAVRRIEPASKCTQKRIRPNDVY
jgi:hypothetical protein